MLTWPHRATDWSAMLAEVEATFRALAAAIAAHERVLIVCHSSSVQARVREQLQAAGVAETAVRLAQAPCDDIWARDHGPITVEAGGQPILLDFRFNGWGGRYPAAADDAVNRRLHAQGVFGEAPMEELPLVLEGGAIDGDGAGTLLTTSRCLLSAGRNPGYSRKQLEQALHTHLGAERTLWLEHGLLAGDDTDGHVDTLARFCGSDTIVYSSCDDPRDEHHAELQALAYELEGLTDPGGYPYRLVPLPLPSAQYDGHGQRLPANYVNFLAINGAVLVPAYDDPADALAQQRLATLLPQRRVVPIDCRPLIQQYGSLHCATMQLPASIPV